MRMTIVKQHLNGSESQMWADLELEPADPWQLFTVIRVLLWATQNAINCTYMSCNKRERVSFGLTDWNEIFVNSNIFPFEWHAAGVAGASLLRMWSEHGWRGVRGGSRHGHQGGRSTGTKRHRWRLLREAASWSVAYWVSQVQHGSHRACFRWASSDRAQCL